MSEKCTTIQLGRKKHKAYYELQELKTNEAINGESCIFAYCYFNNHTQKESRVFLSFPSYLDFVKVLKDATQKTFHEVIQTDQSFRVFFDIDARPSQKDILSTLIDAILKYFESIHIQLLVSKIAVLESIKEEKISYHIILTNVSVENIYTLQKVYEGIKNQLKEDQRYVIDCAIHKNKTLRTCYSTHVNQLDPFEFIEEWEYNGETIVFDFEGDQAHPMVRHFEASFVNCFVNVEHHLHFEEEKKKCMEQQHLDIKDMDEYLKLVQEKIPEGLEMLNVTKQEYVLVSLKNKNGYICPTCDRVHEKENPFVSINSNGIYFHCRRSEGNKSTCLHQHNVVNTNIMLDDIITKFSTNSYHNTKEMIEDLKQVIAISNSSGESIIAIKIKTLSGYTFCIKPQERFFKSIQRYRSTVKKEIKGKEKMDKIYLKDLISDHIHQFLYRDGISMIPLRPDESPNQNKTHFNLFRGWQSKLVDHIDMNKIEPILKHFREVYAKDNDDNLNYILSYLASMVQKPTEKAQSCICLIGPEGTGKNIIFSWFIKYIVGTKYSFITDRLDYITGRFNSSIINKLFIICDEVSSNTDNYYVDMNRLKALITNDTIAVEMKGLEVEEYINYSRIIIFSNNPKCLTMNPGTRRFAVFGTSDKYCKNKSYFDNLYSCLNSDTANHFLTFLFQYDISNWDHNKIPETEEKQNMTISNEIEFLLYHLDASKFDANNRISSKLFYEEYLNYCLANYISPKKINKIDLSPYAENCKWDSGKIRGYKKLFTKSENNQIILNKK